MSLLYSKDFILQNLRSASVQAFDDGASPGMLSIPPTYEMGSVDARWSTDTSRASTPVPTSPTADRSSVTDISSLSPVSYQSASSGMTTLSGAHADTTSQGPPSPVASMSSGRSQLEPEDEREETETDMDLQEPIVPVSPSKVSMLSHEQSAYELNLDDDSEFEEDFLRAAQQIKLTLETQSTLMRPRKSTSNSRYRRFSQRRRPSAAMGDSTVASLDLSTFLTPTEASTLDQQLSPESFQLPRPAIATKASQDLVVQKRPVTNDFALIKANHSSLLSEKIRRAAEGLANPLEQYRGAAGDGETKLKVYFPSSQEPKRVLSIDVRSDCQTHMAIGYALYLYSKEKFQPALTREDCDANKWNVRMVEDDGEPDEDFPPLDRVRPIKSYSVDEIAIVRASDEEYQENSRRTPNRPGLPDNLDLGDSGQPQRITVHIFVYPFDALLSTVYWEDTFPRDARVQAVLDAVCKEKMLDSAMYMLRDVQYWTVMQGNETLKNFEEQANYELTPKRTLYTEDGRLDTNVLQRRDGGRGHATVPSLSMGLPPLMQPLGYYKYKVWRRQQMNFMARHERELAIDGEYIHIMPPSERSLLDAPKLTTFHARQVIRVKQSAKVPRNFKIIVMKEAGPKRYDLEGTSPAETSEIVEKLKRLSQKTFL